ncbi:MAG TPA: hypothetical protein VLW75_10590 [Rhizomicrobium sp.]|nr:hypothetical protein [Rhizomicrobium sp.]
MQISASSLLAAQQARAAQPAKTPARPADSELFEPLLFAEQPESRPQPAKAAIAQPQQGVARMGAHIDIRV